jgi:hypothetical protein
MYVALIAGAIAGLTASQQGLSEREAIVTGLLSSLGVLSARGLGEGAYDAKRQSFGDVRASDVTSNR